MTYEFRDRLTAHFPSQIIVDITEVCNLACIHCPHPEFKKSEHYGARYLEPWLNSKMVAEVNEHGAQYIRYASEGEPMIHPQVYDMLDEAVHKSGTFVTLTTNGTILNEKRTRRLLNAGLHMVDVSIDAHTAETYASIRVNGVLDVTRGNVLRLLKWACGTPTKVVVSYVEQPQNKHETAAFEKFWTEAGAHHVLIRRLHSAAGAVVPIANIMHMTNAKYKRRPCVYPWERIVLNPRGHLAFCPADWTHGSFVADYRTATIFETWRSDFYKGLRDAHLKNAFANHKFCGQCPDWAATRWPDEGRAYADLVKDMQGA